MNPNDLDRDVLDALDALAWEQFKREFDAYMAFIRLAQQDYDNGPIRKGETISITLPLPSRFTVKR